MVSVNDACALVAVSHFYIHNYSIDNQLLAWSQCIERGIRIADRWTFARWVRS